MGKAAKELGDFHVMNAVGAFCMDFKKPQIFFDFCPLHLVIISTRSPPLSVCSVFKKVDNFFKASPPEKNTKNSRNFKLGKMFVFLTSVYVNPSPVECFTY